MATAAPHRMSAALQYRIDHKSGPFDHGRFNSVRRTKWGGRAVFAKSDQTNTVAKRVMTRCAGHRSREAFRGRCSIACEWYALAQNLCRHVRPSVSHLSALLVVVSGSDGIRSVVVIRAISAVAVMFCAYNLVFSRTAAVSAALARSRFAMARLSC